MVRVKSIAKKNAANEQRRAVGGKAPRHLQKVAEVAKGMKASDPEGVVVKKRKKYRAKTGTKALREISKMQKSTDPLIPLAVCDRLAREILAELDGEACRFTRDAIKTLRCVSEDHLVRMFTMSQGIAAAHKKKSLSINDLRTYFFVANEVGPYKHFDVGDLFNNESFAAAQQRVKELREKRLKKNKSE